MIIKGEWQKFETELLRTERLSVKKKLALMEEFLRYAKSIGAVPATDILDGIDVDIKIARVINNVRKAA